jgi:hypothetical protein
VLISPVPQAPPSAREHPRGALNVAALRDATNSHSIKRTFRHRCRAQRRTDRRTPAPDLQTPQGMLAAVITEARAALVGDRSDSTANRMTQPNRFRCARTPIVRRPRGRFRSDDGEPARRATDRRADSRSRVERANSSGQFLQRACVRGARREVAMKSWLRWRRRQNTRTELTRSHGMRPRRSAARACQRATKDSPEAPADRRVAQTTRVGRSGDRGGRTEISHERHAARSLTVDEGPARAPRDDIYARSSAGNPRRFVFAGESSCARTICYTG